MSDFIAGSLAVRRFFCSIMKRVPGLIFTTGVKEDKKLEHGRGKKQKILCTYEIENLAS